MGGGAAIRVNDDIDKATSGWVGGLLLIPADEFGPGVRLLREPVAVLQNL